MKFRGAVVVLIALGVVRGGLSVDAREGEGVQLFFSHVKQGKTEEAAKLLKDDPSLATATDKQGRTPLHHAASRGNGQLVALLVEAGADVNARDAFEETPLFLPIYSFADEAKRLEVAKFLIGEGAIIETQNKWRLSPLGMASYQGRLSFARLLVDSGAKVDYRNSDGSTALFLLKDLEVARYLVDQGADVNARDHQGQTPLHTVKTAEVAAFLIESGAEVKARADNGATPLHRAANREIAETLLKAGADVNAKNKDGYPAALTLIDVDTIDYLVESGTEVDPAVFQRFRIKLLRGEMKRDLKKISMKQQSRLKKNKAYAEVFADLEFKPAKQTTYAYYLGADKLPCSRADCDPCGKTEVKPVVATSGFVVYAVGNVDGDETCDVWTINQDKEIKNLVDDLK